MILQVIWIIYLVYMSTQGSDDGLGLHGMYMYIVV